MWLLFALLTVFLTSILGILFRVVAQKAKEPRAFSFVYNLTIFLFSLLLLVFTGVGKVSLTPWVTVLVILSGIGYGLFQRYQFTVRKHLTPPETQIIMTPTGLVGYVLAILWLNEAVTLTRVIGYALVIIATFVVLKKPGLRIKFNKYVLLSLFIGAALSIAITLNRQVAPHFANVLTYSAILLFTRALVTFLPSVSIKSMEHEIKSQSWRIPVLAVMDLFALLTQLYAITLAPATKVGPVVATNVVFIAILSAVFLKERDRLLAKFVAAIIATVGLVLVSR